MKKKLALSIGAVIIITILGIGVFNSGASVAEATMSTDEIKTMVTKQYPGEITEIEQDIEFNRAIYEVEIKGDEKEYDLKIDGDTGEVLEINEKPIKNPAKVVETDKVKEEASNTKEVKIKEKEVKVKEKKDKIEEKEDNIKEKKTKQNAARKTVISVEEAKEIALNEFPGKIEDVDLDEEDGRLIYEIEIERGDKEAELEIDAYTGEIIVIEIDED